MQSKVKVSDVFLPAFLPGELGSFITSNFLEKGSNFGPIEWRRGNAVLAHSIVGIAFIDNKPSSANLAEIMAFSPPAIVVLDEIPIVKIIVNKLCQGYDQSLAVYLNHVFKCGVGPDFVSDCVAQPFSIVKISRRFVKPKIFLN